jgi:uncharacterized membrane protein HdeD (DUF308 family)
MTTSQPDFDRFSHTVAASIREHWRLVLIEGILLIVLGVAAVIVPPIAGIEITLLLGSLLLVSGLFGLVSSFSMRNAPGFWWSLLAAAWAIIAGVLLLGWPVTGLLSLTFVLIAYFIVEGITTILYALEHRQDLPNRWGWMLTSGIVDLILAGLVIAGLPGTATWALGLLVGIDLVFGGSALIALALEARAGDLT